MNLVTWNPVGGRRRGKRKAHKKHRARRRHASKRAPARRRSRRRSTGFHGIARKARRSSRRGRRGFNPIGRGFGGIGNMVMSSAIGAAGAVGADILFAKVPFLSALTPTKAALAKAGLALAVGIGGKKYLGDKAIKIADGILTIELYNVLRTQAAARFPTLGLNPTVPAVAAAPAAPAAGVQAYQLTNSYAGKIPGRGPFGAYHHSSARGGPVTVFQRRTMGSYTGNFDKASPGAMDASPGGDN